ncbi:hypothetical protein PR003_g22909 [Phytophthora rubi]|uniref:Uncharacterized protein n=1 Tax=Phytophthora rubi TaxID=129364 RepID=A0A6A4D482_9STRA|nr:hypothetical protein PR001_g21943 [Phytophthora rubi]KAE9299776.1 hypothetical protein PR003_g22909 [Phytophthora rubi]
MAKPAVSDPAEAAHVSDSAVAGPASSASSASGAAGSAPSSDPPATEDAAESSPRANDRSQVGSAPARPLMAPVPCNPLVWAPVMEVAFSSRSPDEPLFESPLELEEFFRAHSPSPPPSPDAAAEPDASSNPDSQRPGFQLRSILKDRSAGDSFPLVEPPQQPTRDDPAMRPVSPASPADPDRSGSPCLSPAYSKTNSSLSSCTPSPPRTPVPPGFRPDGLMEAGIPSRPSADSSGPPPSSPALSAGYPGSIGSPPSLVGSPCSVAEDESTPATVAELWGLLQRQERARRDHEKNQARLTAYALLRPPTSSDAGFRRDLLSADSSCKMLEILQADAPEPPCSTKELAELRKEAQRHTELITSFRKIVCTHEAQMREVSRQSNRRVDSSQVLVDHLRRMVETRDKDLDRLMGHLKERDVAYTALQGVSSSYFAQIQEAAQVVSSGGPDRALRFANQTIHEQRRVIQQQKNILRHHGQIAVTDPALALAAAAGLDAPGLSPSELAINARLCRLLEARWPELARISDDELCEVTLRVSGPVAPVHVPASLPTPNPVAPASPAVPDESTLDFDVPSVEPRRVPESRYARDHLTPATRPSVHLPTTPATTASVSGAAAPVAAVSQVGGQTLLGSTDSSGGTAPAPSAAGVNSPPSSTPAPPAAETPNSAPIPAAPAAVESTATSKKKASKPAASSAVGPVSSPRSVKSSQSSAQSNKSAGTKKSVPPRTTGKRMAAQNARVLQAIEIQTLEASDDAVFGDADGGPSTTADNPVVVGSSSASSESDPAEESESSASHSAASSADSDSESADSADRSDKRLKDAKALEALRTWSTKMKDAHNADDDDDDEELEDKPASPARSSSKKARKTSTVAKSKSSSVKPTASKSTSSKSAARKSAPSTSTAHKPAPSKSDAAKSAKSVSASPGQSAGHSASSDLPDVLTLPLATLRTRAAQAVARDSRVPAQMKIWRNPPFFHLGSARCWDKILASCAVTIEMETVDGKSCVKPTPSSPEGIAAFLDVTSTQHPCQRLRSKLPDLVFFMSPSVLRRVKSRRTSPKTAPPVEIVAECWLKCRGERPDLMKIFIALYERMHWVVDSSVILGLHPDLNPGRTPAELALALKLWQQYIHERKRRSDALRPVLNELYSTLYQASKVVDSANDQPAPDLDPELYFDPSVPFAPPANLPWVPFSADWCAASALIDQEEPWRAWWLRQPPLHPYNECFLPLHPEFPVFSPAEFDYDHARRQVTEALDPSAPTPPVCSTKAPTPANREGLDIFESILEASDDASA